MDRRLTLFLLVIALGLNLAPFRAAGAQPAQLVAPDLERGTFQDTNAEGEEASAAAPADIPAAERAALFALYNSTNGPNWKNHTGWLVNEDLCTWYGVVCWFHVYVSQISLSNNGLQGTLPSELGNFTNLLDLIARVDPRAYRMLVLQAHYRSPVEVNRDTATSASAALERFVKRLHKAGTDVVFAGVRPHVRRAFGLPGLRGRSVRYVSSVEKALAAAKAKQPA